MQRYLLLSILFVTFLSCKKNKTAPQEPPSVLGVWEIRETGSGSVKTYSPGNNMILKFTGDTYEYNDAGQITASGTYKVIEDKEFKNYPYMIMFNNIGYGSFYKIEGNRLTTLFRGLTPGGTLYYSIYERINP